MNPSVQSPEHPEPPNSPPTREKTPLTREKTPLTREKTPLTRENCTYTSAYCEENVYKLCQSFADPHNTYVIFITNPKKCCPVWTQQASEDPDHPVFWDYHVIMVYKPRCNDKDSCEELASSNEAGAKAEPIVFDLDSTLPFPTPLSQYTFKAFRTDLNLLEEYKQRLRVVPGEKFLHTFSSDRGHMKREDGTWLATPPAYPAIMNSRESNLMQWIDTEDNELSGEWVSVEGLAQCLAS